MLAELLREGKVKPVIDRTYWSGKTADAIRYLEEGHTHGKIVVAFE
jgi:NADPH:quinone reductase-like Zn-dependent oxidoreductase